jgi:hypothetical protein
MGKYLLTSLLFLAACAPPPTSHSYYYNYEQQNGETIVEVIDPCGDNPSKQFEEVLLRLSNGQILAHFSSGNKEFFSLLSPGNYVTTDGTNCHFTVDAKNNITY